MPKTDLKGVLTVSSETKKTFNYQKGNVVINLTLRNDIKQDLKDAIDICERFIQDALEELKIIKK